MTRRVVILFALALASLPSPAAAAPEWALTQLPEESSTLYGMSCPSSSLCVVSGSNDVIGTSTNPTGGPGAWSIVWVGEGIPGGEPHTLLAGMQIRGVSCPSTGLCVAVSQDGHIYSSANPTGGAAAWHEYDASPKGPNIHILGVSCPSVSLCVAVASGGKVLTSTDPLTGPWTLTQLESMQLSGVSCASNSLCVAVSRDGKIASSTDPTAGAAAWQVASQPGFSTLFAISCPASALCVTGNASDVFTSTNPSGNATAWADAPGVTPLQIMALSCTGSSCAAVNNNADVLTSTDPTGGPGAWSFVNALPYTAANGAFGISCPNTSLCAVAAQSGQIATSTDPFGVAKPAKLPGKKHQRRPTVKLTHHPRRLLSLGPGQGSKRVTFRFREIGQHKGFLCKLDRAKFRRCASPKHYLVMAGRHVFRVKAYDPGGFDQTVTLFRFLVRD